MARRRPPVALTVAGSDPSGGAGIQADLKTFCAFGVYGEAVLTALTAQDTTRVHGVLPVPPAFVRLQIGAVLEDIPPGAIKTGMLGSAALITAVADALRRTTAALVVDPVMVASSGARLLPRSAERSIVERLLPLATLVTPNGPETRVLTGIDPQDEDAAREAGQALLAMGARAALIKGGHSKGPRVLDLLVERRRVTRFVHPRLRTRATHGTGCTLSAAIAAGLARNRPLRRAVGDAVAFVHRAIAAAPGLGRGHGPVNHLVDA